MSVRFVSNFWAYRVPKTRKGPAGITGGAFSMRRGPELVPVGSEIRVDNSPVGFFEFIDHLHFNFGEFEVEASQI